MRACLTTPANKICSFVLELHPYVEWKVFAFHVRWNWQEISQLIPARRLDGPESNPRVHQMLNKQEFQHLDDFWGFGMKAMSSRYCPSLSRATSLPWRDTQFLYLLRNPSQPVHWIYTHLECPRGNVVQLTDQVISEEKCTPFKLPWNELSSPNQCTIRAILEDDQTIWATTLFYPNEESRISVTTAPIKEQVTYGPSLFIHGAVASVIALAVLSWLYSKWCPLKKSPLLEPILPADSQKDHPETPLVIEPVEKNKTEFAAAPALPKSEEAKNDS
jgi:hypothetical protein